MTARNYILGLIAGLGLMTMGAGVKSVNVDEKLIPYIEVVEKMNSPSHYNGLKGREFKSGPEKYHFKAVKDGVVVINNTGVSYYMNKNSDDEDKRQTVLIGDDTDTPYPIDVISLMKDENPYGELRYGSIDGVFQWYTLIPGFLGYTSIPVEMSPYFRYFVKKAEEAYKLGRKYADEHVGKIDNTDNAINFHKR